MAGAGYKLFNTGDVLTAAQVNTYLMEQTVMVFADAAARTTALSGVVSEGMISYLKDTNAVEVYNGSAWVASDDPNAIQNTIVDAKGDLISASAADTPARLAVGNNGETLVADSLASTGLRWTATFPAGKNKIINGDFGIWQRGTSFTINSTNAYTADRFECSSGSGGVAVFTRETFTPGVDPVNGYAGTYYLQANYTTSGTSTILAEQKIEDVTTFANQPITFSFWGKVSTGTHSVIPEVVQRFGSGGSSAVVTTASSVTLTTSWARYSVNISVPAITGKTVGAGSSTSVRLNIGTSGVKTFSIWGWQAEYGSVATAFQTATGTLAGELLACQRYYYLLASGNSLALAPAFSNSNTLMRAVVQLPVTMRGTPSLDASSGTDYYMYRSAAADDLFNSLTIANVGTGCVSLFNNTEIASTSGQGGYILTNNASARVAFTAEL